MFIGITYFLASLTLAILLPYLRGDKGNEHGDDSSIYRYPKNFSRVFLVMLPILGGITAFLYLSRPPIPHGGDFVAFNLFGLVMIGLPVLGHSYAERYRVNVDRRGLTVISLFGVRRVEFADIAEIATVHGKGVDYWLFSSTHQCLAKIGGSVGDFESLQNDVESGTRSASVMLYDFENLRGWQECTNDGRAAWRVSRGPALIRDRNRRVNLIIGAGAVLLTLMLAFQYFYLR